MGCTQSTATSTNSANDNKKLDIGSNLIVTKQTNFREDYDIVKQIGEGSISNIYKVRAKSASVDIEKDKLCALSKRLTFPLSNRNLWKKCETKSPS
jgi:hypothetical protein